MLYFPLFATMDDDDDEDNHDHEEDEDDVDLFTCSADPPSSA